jgi:prevent-host-death family protein
MKLVNLHEAKTRLLRLVEEVVRGEEIIIGKAGRPVAVLTAYRESSIPRKPGYWKGKVQIHSDFESLPEVAPILVGIEIGVCKALFLERNHYFRSL